MIATTLEGSAVPAGDNELDALDLVGVKLLSVDIFDTLLVRMVSEPEDVFDLVGEVAYRRALLPATVSGGGFRPLRSRAAQRAYEAARGRGKSDATLFEIYENLKPAIPAADTLLALELEVEALTCRANPSLVRLLRKARADGISIILCSDMYLSAAQISTLLHASGVERDLYNEILVSSDVGVSKRSGDMFLLLLQRFTDLQANQILHLGDNPVADVEAPLRVGLRAFHYRTFQSAPSAREFHEMLFGAAKLGPITNVRRHARSWNFAPYDPWFGLGLDVVGPFVVLFAEWVVRTCVSLGIELLCPLMRDGHVIAPALERAVKRLRAPLTVKPLYASRRSVCLAAALSPEKAIIRTWLENMSVPELFARLGFEMPIHLQRHTETMGSNERDFASGGERLVLDALYDYLNLSEMKGRVRAALSRERSLLSAYVSEVTRGEVAFGLVDFSHNASIGRVVHNIYQDGAVECEPVSLITFGNTMMVTQGLLDGHRIYCYMGGPNLNQRELDKLTKRSILVEEFLYGSEGSVLGYTRDSSGGGRPLLGDCPYNEEDLRIRRLCQQGISAFHEAWDQFSPEGPFSPEWAIKLLARFVELPTQGEAVGVGRIHFRNDIPVCPPHGAALLETMGEDAFLSRASQLVGGERVYWPEGVLANCAMSRLLSRHASGVNGTPLVQLYVKLCAAYEMGARTASVHGAGEYGVLAIAAAQQAQLEVIALGDRTPSLWGGLVGNIRVMSHAEAAEKKPDVAILGTLGSVEAIRRELQSYYPGTTPIIDPLND